MFVDEYDFDGNYFHFNFTDDEVFLSYSSLPIDDDGYPLIPDEVKLEQAIESYCLYKQFEYFYLNNIGNDSRQKMLDYKTLYDVALKEALNFIKLPTYQALIDDSIKNKSRFSFLELFRNGTTRINSSISTSNRYDERFRQYKTGFSTLP